MPVLEEDLCKKKNRSAWFGCVISDALHLQITLIESGCWIVSDGTASCYIGHTTKTLGERFEGHQREYKDTKKRKRCSSSEIIKCKNARIELIEDWSCSSLQEAKAREAHWIATTVGCVNKNLPNQSRKGYKERQAMVTPAPSK